MDMWDFKKWRRKLRFSQAEAGKQLGLSRGAVQKWETEASPVPVAIELACQELLRRANRRPEFGPVTLLYADTPILADPSTTVRSVLMLSEQHPNNESALRAASTLAGRGRLFDALIVEDDGKVVWSGRDLLREIDALTRPDSQRLVGATCPRGSEENAGGARDD